MENVKNTQDWLQKKCVIARFELVCTELDLAITFCKIAATTNEHSRWVRNVANAERAYTSAAYYLDGDLNSGQKSKIREKLAEVKLLLETNAPWIPLRNCI